MFDLKQKARFPLEFPFQFHLMSENWIVRSTEMRV